MKHRITPLFIAVLLIFSIALPVHAEGSADGMEKLVLIQNSKQMIHNGLTVMATQPLTAVKGVTYIAARSIMKEVYGTTVYDSKSKQYRLSNGETELRFTVGNSSYALNGNSGYKGVGTPYLLKGTLMVPLRTLTLHFGINLKSIPKEKKIELSWDSKPVAEFSVSDLNPYATQTQVDYTDMSYHPRGLSIMDERWENKIQVFDQAGTYTVSHWVQDSNGIWSDPYTVTITVKPPNQPPVASFTTDKDTYKMGEFIRYTDLSTDDENRIESSLWTNNERGFFVPGPQIIKLVVTDANGAISEFFRTITILDETLYTKEEFDLLYTEPGEKFGIVGSSVLRFPEINYTINDHEQTFIRANSPETMIDEGIYYEDTVSGNVRFLLHNINNRTVPMKIYILVTNETAVPATVRIGATGSGGPNVYVSTVGRASTGRYLEALQNPKYSYVQIPPGESRLLFQEFSSQSVKPGQVYSMLADVQMNASLKVQVVAIDASRDLTSSLPSLQVLPSHDVHIRGTFDKANRTIVINQTIGMEKSRIIIADNVKDTRISGIDKTTNTPVLNFGNYGVLYTLRMNNVMPHTAIALNPRGGHYAGAFIINGQVVYATNTSILANPNEVGMLYKTGDTTESVIITFVPAAGMMLPINLLLLPMPTH